MLMRYRYVQNTIQNAMIKFDSILGCHNGSYEEGYIRGRQHFKRLLDRRYAPWASPSPYVWRGGKPFVLCINSYLKIRGRIDRPQVLLTLQFRFSAQNFYIIKQLVWFLRLKFLSKECTQTARIKHRFSKKYLKDSKTAYWLKLFFFLLLIFICCSLNSSKRLQQKTKRSFDRQIKLITQIFWAAKMLILSPCSELLLRRISALHNQRSEIWFEEC